MAEKIPSTGQWKIFSGDEIGALLAYWIILKYPVPAGKKGVMINSTVSSKFMKSICENNNLIYDETLTGFKWICNKAIEYQDTQQHEVMFSYEEAIGFCVGMHVRDKDGITAIPVFYELYEELCRKENRTLVDLLEDLRKKYGY